MGFFDNNTGRQQRESRRSMRKPKDEKEGPVYKILTNVAIIGLFIAAGILVVGLVSRSFNRWTTLALLIVAIICLGLLLLLPWIRKVENKKSLVLSWTFVGFTCACVVLWIISAILIILIYDKSANGTITEGFGRGCIIFFQIAIIISLQFVLAQVVASTIMRYQKKYMPFQIVMYISYAFADFWLTCLALCIRFSGTDIVFSHGLWAFLASPGVYTTFAVALVYCLLSSAVINSIEKRRYYNARQDVTDAIERHAVMLNEKLMDAESEQPKAEEAPKQDDTKAKLAKLKEMLDEGLINEEEYNKKREEILSKF